MAKTQQESGTALTDAEVTEFDADEIGAHQLEAETIGLPDLPGKSRLDEREMDMPLHPPAGNAPDSMTEAVMESLRVGVGVAPADEDAQEEDESFDDATEQE